MINLKAMESEQKTQSKLFSWTKSTVQTWKSNEEILFFSKNKLEILHSGYTKPEKKGILLTCQNQKRSAAFHTIQTRDVQYSDSYKGMAVDPKVKNF